MLRGAFSDRYTMVAGMGAGLVEFADSMGIDIRPECRRLGLQIEAFNSFTERISLARFCALLEYCATAADDEAFGIKFGLKYKAGSTGPFGYGLMSAPTLEQFLRFQAEHMSYSAQTSYSKLEFQGDTVFYSWTFAPVIVNRTQFVDLGLTLIMRHMRALFGPPIAAIHVILERIAPKDPRIFREAFGRNVEFAARINRLSIPRRLMTLPNIKGDPQLFRMMDLQCRQLRPSLQEEDDFRDEIERFILSRMSDDEISLSSAALYFGISERTLQRRLAESDTTLNEIRDQLRQRLAGQLMAETALSATEISYRLGYSGPSAFTRSFHRWYGTTPQAFRSQSRASRASEH